jgi:predicted glutamine amidotransferase
MSRMLAYVAAEPLPVSHAVGKAVLAEFSDLARLHADGWGTAWRDVATGRICTAGSASAPVGGEEWSRALSAASTARMLYLRFASRGAPPAPENVQPFLRDDVAFQHNGVIAPREDLMELLTVDGRRELRGSTDSEAYFATVPCAVRPSPGPHDSAAVARAVARVRARFADACLNAMILSDSALFIVHASGGRGAPLAAFADRGFDSAALPKGHDETYNMLRSTVSGAGARIIATTGVDQESWTALHAESVFAITSGGIERSPIGPQDQ